MPSVFDALGTTSSNVVTGAITAVAVGAVTGQVSGALGKVTGALGSVTDAASTIGTAINGGSQILGALGKFDSSSPTSILESLTRITTTANTVNGALGGNSSTIAKLAQLVGQTGVAVQTVQGIGTEIGKALGALGVDPTVLGGALGNLDPSNKVIGPLGGFINSIRGGITGGVNPANRARQQRNPASSITKIPALLYASARGDPVLTHDWVAVIIDQDNPYASNPIYIESFQAPNISFEQKIRFSDGVNTNYAGFLNVGSITLGLYSDDTGHAFKLASSWFEDVFDNKTGGYRAPSEYKKTVKLFIHDPAKGVVAEFTFFGCFPTSWNGNSWSYDSSNPAPLTMTLSVDKFVVQGHATSSVPQSSTASSNSQLPALSGPAPVLISA